MKKFITKDYLLSTDTAKELYSYAEKMPIIDYHCHLSPKEIYEDKKFNNITELWLGGDHYKWRLMRAAGIEEKYITGEASDKEKFTAWAKAISLAIGNPLYEWSHIELKNYFGFEGVLDEESAEEVWDLANEKLKGLSAQQLIRNSNVEVVCTTDDPIDSLEYHKLMAEQDLGFKVYPAWRPDKAMNIEKSDWKDYINKLAEVSKVTINNYEDLLKALKERLDFFKSVGCSIADHGLPHVPFAIYNKEEIEDIFNKRINDEELTNEEVEKFKTSLLKDLSVYYYDLDFVSQLHYGVKRDNNSKLFNKLGNDVGGDNIGDIASVNKLADFLDLLNKEDKLPKTIIYSLNPNDNTAITTVIASFQEGPTKAKIQHGSAWWFNDNYDGMWDQIHNLATQGYLAGFVGMLTDSRSFISYARHEYFRRVLCELIGDYVEKGRYPKDMKKLKKIIEDISYNNTKEYFNF